MYCPYRDLFPDKGGKEMTMPHSDLMKIDTSHLILEKSPEPAPSRIRNVIGALLLTASFAMLILMICCIRGNDIWYDEIFSLVYAGKDPGTLISLTGADVHPPFYYFYLKAVILCGRIFAPGVSAVVLAKTASLLPWFGLFLLAVTVIRKRYSFFTASFFLFLVTVMPQLSNYFVEIRMYSLCLFLITASFLLAECIADGVTSREKKGLTFPFILFFLCGILTAYTQYYACVGIIALYLALTVQLLRIRNTAEEEGVQKSAGRALSFLLVSMALSVLSYLPWLPVLFGQMKRVSASYWIQPLTLRSLLGCVKFLYLPVLSGGSKDYLPAVLMLLATAAVLFSFFLRKDKGPHAFTVLCGIFLPVFVVLTGFILSAVNRPVFVYRYMIPVVGVWYLAYAHMTDSVIFPILSGRGDRKRAGLFVTDLAVYFLLIPFVLGGAFTAKGFYNEESKKTAQMENTRNALEHVRDNDVIITNFDQVTVLMDYYLKEYLKKDVDIRLYEGGTDPAVQLMFGSDDQMISREEIPDLLKSGKRVFFYGSFVSREEILKDWEALGISATGEGSYLLERYWFDIWELSLSD